VTARRLGFAIAFALGIFSGPLVAQAQQAAEPGSPADTSTHWEFSLDAQVGIPRGYIKVGEVEVSGTRLQLHQDLGIDVSEAVEAQVGYHLTPRDALRVTFLHYFLRGNTTTSTPVTYNGETFPPGSLTTNADFLQVSLRYGRGLLTTAEGVHLTGSIGLSYTYLYPKVNDNAEDFYLQELPVPIAGLRLDAPLGRRLGLTAFVEGGGLPRVSSGRQEGGTVYLSQQQAAAGLGLIYTLIPSVQLTAGYRLTYFFQHETSHEDNNAFQLIDNGIRLGVNVRF